MLIRKHVSSNISLLFFFCRRSKSLAILTLNECFYILLKLSDDSFRILCHLLSRVYNQGGFFSWTIETEIHISELLRHNGLVKHSYLKRMSFLGTKGIINFLKKSFK